MYVYIYVYMYICTHILLQKQFREALTHQVGHPARRPPKPHYITSGPVLATSNHHSDCLLNSGKRMPSFEGGVLFATDKRASKSVKDRQSPVRREGPFNLMMMMMIMMIEDNPKHNRNN